MRSGTENLLGIIGFGAAVKVGVANISVRAENEGAIRDHIIEAIGNTERFPGVKVNSPVDHAPQVLSITLPGIRSETVLHSLSREGIFVSSGSACSSNTGHGSYVLRAFGLSDKDADSTVRVSLGSQNTLEESDIFLAALERCVKTLVRR